jgi:hypothetical protein
MMAAERFFDIFYDRFLASGAQRANPLGDGA